MGTPVPSKHDYRIMRLGFEHVTLNWYGLFKAVFQPDADLCVIFTESYALYLYAQTARLTRRTSSCLKVQSGSE
jgi:hypothetical protein